MTKIKRLLILDLNGILIHRVYKNDYFKLKALFDSQYHLGNLERPVFKKNFAIWFRPHVQSFIAWCLEHFHVAIWSSVLQHNIEPLLEALLPEERDRSRLFFWWHQDHCLQEVDDTVEDKKKAISFYKCLSSVWDSAELGERWLLNQPSSTNPIDWRDHTLLIDDNKLKVRDNPPFTSIHPRTWRLFEIVDGDSDIRIFKDHTLENSGALKAWLEQLLEWEGSVIEFVEKHPYVDPLVEEIEKKTDGWGSSWE